MEEIVWDDEVATAPQPTEVATAPQPASDNIVWDDETPTAPQATPEETEAGKKAVDSEVSRVTAEVQQAITTIGDQLGWTDDSEKSMAKFNKEVSRVLNDRGYNVQNRGGKLFAVTSSGTEVPVEAGMVDSLKASALETAGGVGAGIAAGAAGGAVAGPYGAIGGGLVGGVVGAVAGDQFDVSRNADKHDIHISPDERLDRVAEVATADAVGTVVGGAALAGVGKTILASDTFVRNVIGADARGANDVFTTVAEASAPIRKAIKNLQKKSGMSDELVEQTIKDYAQTVEGELSAGKAVEALAKSAEKEQTGFAIAAMDDSLAKSGAIDEMTKRTAEIEKAFKGDEELEAVLKKHTVNDEGRRTATDWNGLKNSLDNLGFQAGDPIYDKIVANAKSLGSKEKDIFSATVKPEKSKEGVAETLSPFADTARGSVKSQLFATGIQAVDNFLTRVLPNADASTINIIKSSMKKNTDPIKLSDELISQGHDVQLARKIAREVEAFKVQEAKEAEKTAAKEAKEAEKNFAKKETEFGKIQAKDDKPSIEAGIDKEVTEFKKTKVAMQKEEVGKAKKLEAKEKQFAKIEEADSKTSIEAGIDKEVTEFKKTKVAMQKEETGKLKKLEAEGKQKLNDQIDLDVISTLDGIKSTSTEAKNLNQLAKIAKRTGDDADITKFVKAKQEILSKKKATADRKTKLEALKKEADKPTTKETPSAMTAGIKQTTMDLEDNLFTTPSKKVESKKVTRKPTPNQVEAKKVQEANPDDKEAIKKALTRKSPEVQAKKDAEAGLAEEAMHKENYATSKKTLKKKVNTLDDMEDLKEVTKNPNSTKEERAEARRRRRAVSSREAFGSDDVAVKYKEWADDSRSGFGDFIVEKKNELNLDYNQVKKYYEVNGDNIPPKVQKAYEAKKETSKAMSAGIKRDYTKDLGEEGQKAYEAWAKDVVKYTKVGSNPNVSLNKFRRSSAGKPYRIKGD